MDEPIISWSAKELLERLERKMDAGFQDMGTRLTVLEADRAVRKARRNYRAEFWNLMVIIATVLAAGATVISVMHL